MKLIKNKKGTVLIASYLVITVLAILGSAFVSRSISEVRVAQRQKNSMDAFYLAEAGIDKALVYLRSLPNPPGGTGPFDPLGGSQGLGSGGYTITIDPDDNNPSTSLKRYKIISSGFVGNVTDPEVTRQLLSEVRLDSYARYAYFTDDEHFRWYGWRIPVWFITGDLLEGPTQTNSHLHISGDPVFAGLVRTADDFITYMHGGPPADNPDFQEGIELGVEPVRMPSKALELRSVTAQEGLKLNGPTSIVLQSDGTMNVTNSQEGWVDENMPLPENGALFVNAGNLTISGTLNGQLTVGTNRNIIIPDNLVYNNDPRIDPSSTDMLGVIAERDVIIDQDAPYDLEINVSLMALGNSFLVERWWEGLKGTLTLYGGVIQDYRGPVGTFNSDTNTKISGYTKDYHYDPRLASTSPPYYPTTKDYIFISWKEVSS